MDLKQSVAIPGTKVKVPIIEVVAAGAAVIGAYVLLKGQSSQSADISSLPADTTNPDATTTDATSALTGQLETMGQELAAIEAAMQPGSAAATSGGGAASVGGSPTGAAAAIPLSDPTQTGAAAEAVLPHGLPPGEYISPNAFAPLGAITTSPVIAGAFDVAHQLQQGIAPLAKSVTPEPTTAPATASNNPSTANLATKIAPNPVPAAKSANAASSTNSAINPKGISAVTVKPVTPAPKIAKALSRN